MTRQPLIAKRVEDLLGSSVIATAPVAGGDISTATRVRLSDGTTALVKTHHQAPEGFFDAEARGLALAGRGHVDGGVAVPEVLAHDHECLILRWVEPGKNTIDAAVSSRPVPRPHPPRGRRRLRRRPRRVHRQAADAQPHRPDLGRSSTRPAGCSPTSSWPATGAPRPRTTRPRSRAVLRAAGRPGPRGAAVSAARRPLERQRAVGTRRRVPVIDPAAYGGHREVDLAMLSLFGLPHLQRVLDAYEEEHPLADGWRDRLGLHQLFPLLVHACLFGGGYARRAADDRRAVVRLSRLSDTTQARLAQ